MLDYKRELEELITIYSYEEDLIDIYVEGPTDKFIINNYLEYKRIDKSVIEIADIDLTILQEKYQDLNLRSNKDKLIALSRILSENDIKSSVKCVVDRDFDGILSEFEDNAYIQYTDFCCMESYVICKKHIDKLLQFGIKNFPFESQNVIIEISKVLSGLFLMRMINKKFGFNFRFPKIENNMLVIRTSGVCNFDFKSYLETFINVNKINGQRSEILTFVDNITQKFDKDIRFQMNGHDFIEVLFNYINKIKNTPNFRLENFEQTLYLSIQPNYLDEYHLFNILSE